MKLGQFEIGTFVERRFRLDGGSMFGVVPKSMWQKLIAADENNLIPMVTNIFLLKAHGKNFLFDIGFGDTLSEREMKIYGVEALSQLDEGLAGYDLTTDDIDYVILTHLHTDHAGGSVKEENGQYVPRFKNARYIVSRDEWKVATKPDDRTKAVYVPERLLALKDAGQVDFIDRSTELFPGISVVHTGGHTAAHYGLEIESDGQSLFYYADILSTTAHLPVAYIPAVDLYPAESMEAKRKVLRNIVNENVIVALDHDTKTPLVRVKENLGKPVAIPV